jgi:dihydrofolate synthase / folylpolyglutamate synthase
VSQPHRYLFSLEQIGIKLGLEQIASLLLALGRPDLAYPSIVIAGTNGKGSVTAMIERALRAAGYRTGRYTSPHLVGLEERFVVDGQSIETQQLEALIERIRHAADRLPAPPSFFEATTAIALEAFRSAGIEIAVLEVGLGGRLDATNVVSSMAAGITSVDFDHEEYLGHTIEAIAGEKAAVIKPRTVAVLGANSRAVQDAVRARCDAVEAAFVYAPDGVEVRAAVEDGRTLLDLHTPRHHYAGMALSLRGRHQIDNATTAVRLLEELDARGALPVPAEAIRTGLTDAVWPGRLELRSWRGQEVLIDGAHNPAGARALARYLEETYQRRLPIVFGAMRDKNISEMLAAVLPRASRLICTAPRSSRAAAPEELTRTAELLAPPDLLITSEADPHEALSQALASGSPAVVAGSLYLAGEIRAELP